MSIALENSEENKRRVQSRNENRCHSFNKSRLHPNKSYFLNNRRAKRSCGDLKLIQKSEADDVQHDNWLLESKENFFNKRRKIASQGSKRSVHKHLAKRLHKHSSSHLLQENNVSVCNFTHSFAGYV